MPMVETLDMVPFAMVNDFHVWGVLAAPSADCGDLSLEHGGYVRLPRSVMARKRHARSLGDGSDDEATDAISHPASIRSASKPTDSADVEAELIFCNALMQWSPWEAPSKSLEDAMQAVSGKSDLARCLLRSQVIDELATEAICRDALDDSVIYHRGAKYRLALNKPLLHTADLKRQLLDADVAFLRPAVLDNLGSDCGRGERRMTALTHSVRTGGPLTIGGRCGIRCRRLCGKRHCWQCARSRTPPISRKGGKGLGRWFIKSWGCLSAKMPLS